MWPLGALNGSYGTFLQKVFLKNLEFLSFLSNYELFGGLSDSENQKRVTTHVCAMKNGLVHRIITRLSFTHCNYPEDYSKHKFGSAEAFQKISQCLQASTVDLQKAFFALIWRLFDNFEGESQKWRLPSFPQLKNELRLHQTLWFAFLESLRPKQQLRYPSCDRWLL